MRTISYEMTEIVIAGNMVRYRGIYVVLATWFVCSKLRKICFFKFPISQRNTYEASISLSKQIFSGNLEILPGIGKPGKFFGKYKIFSGTLSKDLKLYVIKQYTCTLCMRCILCILALENSLTPHDVKRPISITSN